MINIKPCNNKKVKFCLFKKDKDYTLACLGSVKGHARLKARREKKTFITSFFPYLSSFFFNDMAFTPSSSYGTAKK